MGNATRFQLDDTIVAVSSAAGQAVRAIVRLSGPNCWALLRPFLPETVPDQPQHRAVYETALMGVGSLPPIPVMLLVFRGPRSYTGQDVVEVHLPGCPVLVQAVLEALLGRGGRSALPGEFTLRAFLAGKIDLTRAEALLAVLHAHQTETLHEALRQFAGNLATPLAQAKERLLELLAEVEASLDFPEEDLLFAAHDALREQCRQIREQLGELLQRVGNRGLWREAFRVVLTGRPNAGKSSLFNALLGQRAALVSPIPGTTRDYVTATRSLDGILLELVDTAGIETPDTNGASRSDSATIAAQAQQFRDQQVRQAHLVLYCLPVNEPITPEDMASLEQLRTGPILLVWTKCDLPASLDQTSWPGCWSSVASVRTSAVTGEGLAALEQSIADSARKQSVSDPLAVSLARCQHHVRRAWEVLQQAEGLLAQQEAPELVAVELRTAIEELGAVLGEVYTEDLLERIFSRFCIGK